jgi:hypothetical protein
MLSMALQLCPAANVKQMSFTIAALVTKDVPQLAFHYHVNFRKFLLLVRCMKTREFPKMMGVVKQMGDASRLLIVSFISVDI